MKFWAVYSHDFPLLLSRRSNSQFFFVSKILIILELNLVLNNTVQFVTYIILKCNLTEISGMTVFIYKKKSVFIVIKGKIINLCVM